MNQNPNNAPPGVPFPPGTPTSGGRMWVGLQSSNRWESPIADSGPVQIGDAQRADQLWKVTVFGRQVWVDLKWGPNGRRTLSKLDPPLVVYVPGQVTVEAYPSGIDGPSEAVCMIAPVDSAGVTIARRYVAGNAVTLRNDAAWFSALENSTLNIGGFGPYPVAAGVRVPLRSGSTLTTGSGFEEYDLSDLVSKLDKAVAAERRPKKKAAKKKAAKKKATKKRAKKSPAQKLKELERKRAAMHLAVFGQPLPKKTKRKAAKKKPKKKAAKKRPAKKKAKKKVAKKKPPTKAEFLARMAKGRARAKRARGGK